MRSLIVAIVFQCLLCAHVFGESSSLSVEKVDGFFQSAWQDKLSLDGAVPGALVVVVQNGEVVLNKGYGVSNVETGSLIDPEVTLVRIGSVSKIFTALTVLSLMDESEIALDENVNNYLVNVKVPDTYEGSVTVRSLLSHKSGIDGHVGGHIVTENRNLDMPAEEYQRRLSRMRPIGDVGYDNGAIGLLGELVREVNNTSFADAVRDRVLVPFGMTKSSMGIEDSRIKNDAACHTWDSAGQISTCERSFLRTTFQSGGAMHVTGDDMGRFMLAMLDDTCTEESCVLKPGTYSLFSDMNMNRVHPHANGLGFVLHEYKYGGRQSVGHTGGHDGFSTTLALFPQFDAGVFITSFSYVGLPNDFNMSYLMGWAQRNPLVPTYDANTQAISQFASQFLPEDKANAPIEVAARQEGDLSRLAGFYDDTRNLSSLLFARMLGRVGIVEVKVENDEVIIGDSEPLLDQGDGVLVGEVSGEKWFYTINDHGTYLQKENSSPVGMLAKRPWHYNPLFSLFPLAFVLLMIIPSLLYGLRGPKKSDRRKLGSAFFYSGLGILLGLLIQFEFLYEAYYLSGVTAGLVLNSLLIHAGWLASILVLIIVFSKRSSLIGFSNIRSLTHSAVVILVALSAISLIVLLPYWGLIGGLSI